MSKIMELVEVKRLESRLADYDKRLSEVMPPDFKDWHENNPAERPEIAAMVIANLRAEVAELQAKLNVAQELGAIHIETTNRFVDERDALREALNEYGDHLRACPKYEDLLSEPFAPKCTCGFDAARSAK